MDKPESHGRVVIIGGGFAGLFAARALRRTPVDITLVDRASTTSSSPCSTSARTGILSEGQIAAPLRECSASTTTSTA